jgi:putative two-component system response regulator
MTPPVGAEPRDMGRPGPASARILIVDDDQVVRETIQDSLEYLGYRTQGAGSAEEALDRIPAEAPDLILLDVRMPGITGIELCRQLKADQSTRFIPVVLLTAQGELDSRVAGLEAGADDYFTKPVHLRELGARVRSLLRLKRVLEELEQAENMIASMALVIEARDTYTAGHCVRLSRFAAELGERVGLSEDELAALRLGGYLHDLGKIAVPDSVLSKPGPLSAEEWRLMREHPVAGDRLVRPMRTLGLVLPVIRHHHERIDGRGYPDRLVGDEIPVLARIMAVVDVYDALRTRRPYKPALDEGESLRLLSDSGRSGQLDPDLVRVFAELRQPAERGS